jgi:uncharacterized protein YhfF
VSEIEVDTAAGEAMWAAYREANPQVPDEGTPVVEYFGDSPELADELLDFVTNGPKRATAALVVEFEAEAEPLPRIGSHWIACNGKGTPQIVIRSTELRVGPVSSVDEKFAWDEGEYERTLESWLENHRGYWQRSCGRLGIEYSDELECVFERFRVVWPPELADGTDGDEGS